MGGWFLYHLSPSLRIDREDQGTVGLGGSESRVGRDDGGRGGGGGGAV